VTIMTLRRTVYSKTLFFIQNEKKRKNTENMKPNSKFRGYCYILRILCKLLCQDIFICDFRYRKKFYLIIFAYVLVLIKFGYTLLLRDSDSASYTVCLAFCMGSTQVVFILNPYMYRMRV
jgi:predicted neutral ceramidase superfamily lipid hydrolase